MAQQTGVVSGTVRDAGTLNPLVGAQVFVVGTGIGALSDERGQFSLPAVPGGTVDVQVQLLGYESATRSVTVVAGQTATADFALTVTALSLDEMIVTVTGLQRRREVGYTSTTIEVNEELEKVLPPGLLALLQGRAPGVQVMQSSGTTGSTPTITIRGSSSFFLDDTPIIYVDGTRVSNDLRAGPAVGGQTTSRLSDLNLDDIESVEIVNGPSAATLYGSEAAAGVIRITTKRGRLGSTEWTVYSEGGANWDATDWPTSVWNPRSFFGETFDISDLLSGVPPGQLVVQVPDTLYELSLLDDTDAGGDFGSPWRTGYERSHGMSVRGGSGNVTYFVSGEVTDRLGNIVNNEVAQRSLRANLVLSPLADLSLDLSTGFVSSSASLPNNDDSAFGFIGVGLLASPWAKDVSLEDPVSGGNVTSCPQAVEIQRLLLDADITATLRELDGIFCPENPFYEGRTFDDVATLDNEEQIERFTGSASLRWTPFNALVARATVGYDQFSDQVGALIPVDEEFPFQEFSLGYRQSFNTLVRGLTLDAVTNLTLDLSQSVRSTTALGAALIGRRFESVGSIGRSLPPGISTVSDAVEREGFESISEAKTIGFFIQQQFAYRDKLFITPGFRIDQSSTFGDDRTRATYPHVDASWVLSDEPWFAGVPLLTLFRLRGAYGQSGKQPTPFAALQLLGTRSATFQGRDQAAVVLVGAGNPDLKPERGEEITAGFDARALSDRLQLDLTWYRDVTRDAMIERPIQPSTGYALGQVVNVGEIRNQGFEASLGGILVDRPGLRWEAGLTAGWFKGDVTELEEPIIFGLDDNSQRFQEGFPFGAYFSRTYSMQGDQVVASDTAEFVGQPFPEYSGQMYSTVGFSDWLQLTAVVGFAGGHQQFNATQSYRCSFFGGGLYGGICPEIFEVDGDGGRTDAARIKAQAARDQAISPWIEDADFARLRSVSARIELPVALLRAIRADRGSFTLVGENLALFTGYTGLDPEVNYSGGLQSGRAELFTLPLARRVMGRLSLTF